MVFACNVFHQHSVLLSIIDLYINFLIITVFIGQPFDSNTFDIFTKIEYFEKSTVIKYFYLKGVSPSHIRVDMDSKLKDSSLSYTKFKIWIFLIYKRSHQH